MPRAQRARKLHLDTGLVSTESQQDVNHNCTHSAAVTATPTQELLSSFERHVGDGIADVGRKPSRRRTPRTLDWFDDNAEAN